MARRRHTHAASIQRGVTHTVLVHLEKKQHAYVLHDVTEKRIEVTAQERDHWLRCSPTRYARVRMQLCRSQKLLAHATRPIVLDAKTHAKHLRTYNAIQRIQMGFSR